MRIDSHCHLDYFAQDMDAVLSRAMEAGVTHMVTVGVTLAKFPSLKTICEQNQNIFCTVGIHPCHVDEEETTIDELVAQTQSPHVIAIGESGLDYFHKPYDAEKQRENFLIHIEAARQSNLPLVVHTRDAADDTLDILEQEQKKSPFKGVVHCFSGSQTFADKVLDLGMHISFTGIITYPKNDELRTIVKRTPLECMMAETDAPYLAPVPMRGKKNEPAFVTHVGETIAEIKGISVHKAWDKMNETFFDLYQKATCGEATP